MKHNTLAVGIMAAMVVPAAWGAEEKWVGLLQDDTLEGWKQLGGKAPYEVKDGVITGTAVAGQPNSFLVTEKHYGDFVLEYEFKVEAGLNSGVQIRSNSLPEYENGRVHGIQCEIDSDKPERRWTGGLQEEGRRGWLNDLSQNPAGQAAHKIGEWNKARIEARGPRVLTFINGVACGDLLDAMTLKGFIGLQVHGVGKDTKKVGLKAHWRNIRIQELGQSEWKPIFDGKSLDGWVATEGGKWEVREGILTGTSPASEGKHGILFSGDSHEDFTIRFKFRAIKGNSGFYFHSEQVKNAVTVHGFQAEVDTTTATGGIYETGGRGWVAQPEAKAVEKIYKPGEWTEMSVICQGPRTVVTVNNQKTVDVTDEKGRKSGKFGFQLHGGQEMHVEFKDVELLK